MRAKADFMHAASFGIGGCVIHRESYGSRSFSQKTERGILIGDRNSESRVGEVREPTTSWHQVSLMSEWGVREKHRVDPAALRWHDVRLSRATWERRMAAEDYYRLRDLVPADLIGQLGRAKILITNFESGQDN